MSIEANKKILQVPLDASFFTAPAYAAEGEARQYPLLKECYDLLEL
ncbi:MAG: hypothetical protein JW904_09965 [Spirochaetales bacterium]|nr:hypothetical protein [Spirochaetales bacterium]